MMSLSCAAHTQWKKLLIAITFKVTKINRQTITEVRSMSGLTHLVSIYNFGYSMHKTLSLKK